ncbi:hypothetical protein [Enterococcus sp. 5H]|uniref:hypothetical protein n=1 Tax=Enterococcus sp. 5H TaxID=1229490 RepID=UPI0023021D5F|nr:hypothetical protein [Enterococcus sp. 5H]
MERIFNKTPFEVESLVYAILFLIVLTITIFVTGLIIDHFRKDKYKVNKVYYRTLSNNVGGGEEYYYRYWAWQPNKRKFYTRTLLEQHGINRPYFRKAMQNKKLKKSVLPFRREIYGKAQ